MMNASFDRDEIERQQARAEAKLFADACRSGDVGQFYAAVEAIQYSPDGWTLAFRRVAQLSSSVPEAIQHELVAFVPRWQLAP
jgi:hypothetical protein